MRCEICNKYETEEHVDGEGIIHHYCPSCADEIEDTLGSYDEDDWDFTTFWQLDDFDEDEDNSEEDQEVTDDGGSAF